MWKNKLFLIILFLLCTPVFAASPTNVVIIREIALPPYPTIIQSFKSNLGEKYKFFTITPSEVQILKKTPNIEAFFCLGFSALKSLIRAEIVQDQIIVVAGLGQKKLPGNYLKNPNLSVITATKKSFYQLKTAYPLLHFKTLGALFLQSDKGHSRVLNQLKLFCAKYDITLVPYFYTAKNISEVSKTIKNIDVLYLLDSASLLSHFPIILEQMNKNNVPVIGSFLFFKLGSAVSVSPSAGYMGKIASSLVQTKQKAVVHEVAEYTIDINLQSIKTNALNIDLGLLFKGLLKK